MDAVAIVPAAGSGERLGLHIPKALAPIGSTTIIQRTVETIASIERIQHIFVLAPSQYEERMRLVLASDRVSVHCGGATRQESVALGLRQVSHYGSFNKARLLVLVHDAARCLVRANLIERCLDAAVQHGAVTAGVRSVDSIKRINRSQCVVESLDRSELIMVQTPQVFTYDIISRAHGLNGARPQAGTFTDDASLVETFHPVRVVWGEHTNFKITTADDLEMARLLAARAAFSDKNSG